MQPQAARSLGRRAEMWQNRVATVKFVTELQEESHGAFFAMWPRLLHKLGGSGACHGENQVRSGYPFIVYGWWSLCTQLNSIILHTARLTNGSIQ